MGDDFLGYGFQDLHLFLLSGRFGEFKGGSLNYKL
jgi:hypothetical protein